MSLRHQQQGQPKMLHAVRSTQNTGPGKSGYLKRPHSTFSVEAQMAQQARDRIQARWKMAMLFQQYRAQLTSNKYGVTVTSDPPSTEEKICLTVYGNNSVVPLTVKNSGAQTVNLIFWASDLVKNIFTVRDCHGNIIKTAKQHTLGPGEEYKIKVHFHSDHAGFYEQLLVFTFETQQESSDKFQIMRLLEVIHQIFFSQGLPRTATNSVCKLQTVRQKPAKGAAFQVSLKSYTMPDSVRNFRKCDMILQKPLEWKNYAKRFHLLLHLEELQMKRGFKKYNQDNVPIFRHRSNSDLLVLQIADVPNGLPSNLSKNEVTVSPLYHPGVFGNKTYKGWVHHVYAEQAYLKFDEKFLKEFQEGTRFRVDFHVNRSTLRMQHRAVELAHKHRLREVLFPTGQLSSHHSHLHRLQELKINPEQRTAVQHIVAASAKPAPYLVFGPPGTGKTVTLVEAIKQIVNTQASCNILACAPSNSATDHLCERILQGEMGSHKVYRLYALTNPTTNFPENRKFCCNLDGETNTFIIPHKNKLMKYKIVVTTLQTAGRLVSLGIRPGHYTYIFVDEAGQATETECIIPIAGLLKPQTCQVVLAGDPKQLGPIITSRLAKEHGMGVSLLERLMTDISLYQSHETEGFNNRFVTKLLRNYRSHPAILKIPNELFYKGELQPYAEKEKYSSYCKWDRLPKKGFPLIFHGVAGTDERDSGCPSVYNMAEVEVVKEYLKALVDYLHKKGVTKIGPGEIGIIAPYNKQVEKIQNALQMDKDLRKENLENILVGSVEKFQGKEFNVILVSAVRSNPKLTEHKQRFTLGFVNDGKRFNVAMTRAQALLIVIGDPRLLKTDPMWNKFIYYCSKKGAYRGITVSDEENEEDELTDAHSPEPLWRVIQRQFERCQRDQQTSHTHL